MVCPKYKVAVVARFALVDPVVITPVKLVAAELFINVELTVWEMLTVQLVPEPPVITVSCETPTPNKTCPIAIVPLWILETVRVVPDIDPVNIAVVGVVMRHE
jgi:hypothetical protein